MHLRGHTRKKIKDGKKVIKEKSTKAYQNPQNQ